VAKISPSTQELAYTPLVSTSRVHNEVIPLVIMKSQLLCIALIFVVDGAIGKDTIPEALERAGDSGLSGYSRNRRYVESHKSIDRRYFGSDAGQNNHGTKTPWNDGRQNAGSSNGNNNIGPKTTPKRPQPQRKVKKKIVWL